MDNLVPPHIAEAFQTLDDQPSPLANLAPPYVVEAANGLVLDEVSATFLAQTLRRVADQVEREQPPSATWSIRNRVVELDDPDGCGYAHRELGDGYRSVSFEIMWGAS